MICSTSVVPERGMPITKIGLGEASPPPDFASIQSRRERQHFDPIKQGESGLLHY